MRSTLTIVAGLRAYKRPDWKGNWRMHIRRQDGYGSYPDIHERICKISKCRRCQRREARDKEYKFLPEWHYLKDPEFWGEMYGYDSDESDFYY
jgi:hypothetical protein